MNTNTVPGDEQATNIATNPNPAANENVQDKTSDTSTTDNTGTVGTEITDGEDA
jgi:hypothetical protein